MAGQETLSSQNHGRLRDIVLPTTPEQPESLNMSLPPRKEHSMHRTRIVGPCAITRTQEAKQIALGYARHMTRLLLICSVFLAISTGLAKMQRIGRFCAVKDAYEYEEGWSVLVRTLESSPTVIWLDKNSSYVAKLSSGCASYDECGRTKFLCVGTDDGRLKPVDGSIAGHTMALIFGRFIESISTFVQKMVAFSRTILLEYMDFFQLIGFPTFFVIVSYILLRKEFIVL